MKSRKLISIIIPVHNEAPNLDALYKELTYYTDRLSEDVEFIFVDDGSNDESIIKLEQLAQEDHRVRLVEFARNFGKEAAISAGLHASRGDAALMLDADLQHPPKLISKFVRAWHKGADVVVGIRQYDRRESWFKRWASARFYQIMQAIAHTKITPHASDYRLVDRKVMDAFSRLTERNRMTRGLIDWLGFRRAYVPFESNLRRGGEPSGSTGTRQLFKLAVNSFTSYSLVPLKLAGYLGVFILATATPAGLLLYVERYVLNDPLGWEVRGTAMLAILLVILVGLVLACLGLVSLYIANIHAEVTNRPLYVVRRHIEEIPEDAPVMTWQREGVKQ
jgi:dolichol-phosphate mannosyltransferase